MARATAFCLCLILVGSLRGMPASAMISREYIQRGVRAHLPEIRACYEAGLRVRPGMAGRLVVRFTILGDGNVSTAEITSSTLQDPGVERCIADEVRAFRFPPIEGTRSISVSYPFVFEAEDVSN